MKIKYFADTDTAYMEFNDQPVHESMPIGDDVVLDLDMNGRLVALTLEHAQARGNVAQIGNR